MLQLKLHGGREGGIIAVAMKKFLGAVAHFIKGEVVLCVAVLLAIISSFFVPPSAGYLDYIDWDTIALLFSLMAVMKGFQRAGLFSFLANKLLRHANTSKKIMAVLVFAPFFFSMAVTNDVSLITFVPFALIVLKAAGLSNLVIPTVVLQSAEFVSLQRLGHVLRRPRPHHAALCRPVGRGSSWSNTVL